jgi:hypothetical protein
MTRAPLVVSWLLLGLTGAGCAGTSDSAAGAPSGGGSTPNTGAGAGVGTSTGAAGAGGGNGTALPPETEVESSYEVPVATGNYIWVANPDSGRVAYVNGAALDVHTVEAGNAPTYMSPIPSTTGDAVVVLNVLSDDATILRIDAGGTLTAATVSGVADGANALAVSSSGRWVIAWTDARQIASPDPLLGYQNVTVMDLSATPPSKRILSVGFRPVAVAYAGDDSKAFAVTEDGVSVIALTGTGGPLATGNVALTDDPTEDADTRDVSITPNGQLAVVRREGSPSVEIVDLATGLRSSIDLSGPVTDVDLTVAGDRAVAVVRDTAEVAIIPLGGGLPDPAAVTHVTITGETVGSVSIAPDGNTALLYTNASSVARMTVLTLGTTPTYRVVKLHAPVLSVFATPDGANAIVLHGDSAPATAPTDGGAGDADGGASVGDAGVPSQTPAKAFSLVPLDSELPAKIQETDVPPQSVAISPAGDRVLITERDDKQQIYGVYLAQFPSLEIDPFKLASPPIAVGVLAGANEGFVAQKHPEGRITFLTLDSAQARTLTGFEIGAGVIDWSQSP